MYIYIHFPEEYGVGMEYLRKHVNISIFAKKYQKGNNYQMIKGVAQTARLSIRNGNSFTLNTKTQ